MEIKNRELYSVKNRIDTLLNEYRQNKISDSSFIDEVRTANAVLKSTMLELNNKIQSKKFPRSSAGYSKELLLAGELAKQRAYQLLTTKDEELIKSELKKEAKQGNYDFCFTLSEAVFRSNMPDSFKAGLSNLYVDLLNNSGVSDPMEELEKAKVVKTQTDSIENNYGKSRDELVRNVMLETTAQEIKYTRYVENWQKRPAYQIYEP